MEKLPDASLLLNSPAVSSNLMNAGDHSSRVAAALAENASRKRDSNGLASSTLCSKVPKSNLPPSRNAPDTSGVMLVPPQLKGSNKLVMLLLKDIVPAAQNNIDTKFILLEKGRPTIEGQNKTCLALVADETASVHFQFWGDECDAFETGDIISLTNGIFSYHRSNLLLRAGKRGKVQKLGEFTMAFVETPNLSEIRWIPDPNNSNKYVQESVISPYSRIFPPLP